LVRLMFSSGFQSLEIDISKWRYFWSSNLGYKFRSDRHSLCCFCNVTDVRKEPENSLQAINLIKFKDYVF
jgi:hypothetical protein